MIAIVLQDGPAKQPRAQSAEFWKRTKLVQKKVDDKQIATHHQKTLHEPGSESTRPSTSSVISILMVATVTESHITSNKKQKTQHSTAQCMCKSKNNVFHSLSAVEFVQQFSHRQLQLSAQTAANANVRETKEVNERRLATVTPCHSQRQNVRIEYIRRGLCVLRHQVAHAFDAQVMLHCDEHARRASAPANASK